MDWVERGKRFGRDSLASAKNFISQKLHVHRDPTTGFFVQNLGDRRVFMRRSDEYISENELNSLCEDIYFRHYEPRGQDVVVDFGAGYGHEALWLLRKNSGVRYFGVEVQPSIYECLCNSFRPYSPQCKAIPIAVTESGDSLYINSDIDYIKASTVEEGYIEVLGWPWASLKSRYGIGRVDLLKINIEGAEVGLLPALGELREIERVIISAHDFRAEAGEGDHFRTRDFVMAYLSDRGFHVQPLSEDTPWLRDWIYADRTARP